MKFAYEIITIILKTLVGTGTTTRQEMPQSAQCAEASGSVAQ